MAQTWPGGQSASVPHNEVLAANVTHIWAHEWLQRLAVLHDGRVVVVVVVVVVVIVVSPQSGGVGFVAVLQAARLPLFVVLQECLQFLPALPLGQTTLHALNSFSICVLQSLWHLARAGEAVRQAPTSSTANRTNQGTLAFTIDLGP